MYCAQRPFLLINKVTYQLSYRHYHPALFRLSDCPIANPTEKIYTDFLSHIKSRTRFQIFKNSVRKFLPRYSYTCVHAYLY